MQKSVYHHRIIVSSWKMAEILEMKTASGEPSALYYLSEAFVNGQTFLIDTEQYSTFNEALTTVVSAMEIEDLFQIFAQSFLRFEKHLLDVSLEYNYVNMRITVEPDDFLSNARHNFNVNIITILTSFKSYDDHCNRILNTLRNPPKAVEFNCQKRYEIFNTHLSYRICALLRDYAQHRALPLGGFSIGPDTNLARDGAGNVRKLDTGFNVSPWLNVAKFKKSSQCKQYLRDELDCLDYEKIDIKWLVRSFAGAMYERHAALRAFLKPEIEAAGEQIAAAYNLASVAKKSEAKFLELYGDGKIRPMRNDIYAKVLRAFETYTSLKGAGKSYVTSQIKHEAATYSGQVDP